MRAAINISVAMSAGLVATTPALAGAGTPLPAPDSLALLALGLAGLILGRRASSRRHDDQG